MDRHVQQLSQDEAAALRTECDRMLASPEFQVSARNRRFLDFIVGETVAGRGERLKAYTIATRVFERDDRFDPQLDSIVRIEAGRLRRAIERFYLAEGARNGTRLAIPKGSYVPRLEGGGRGSAGVMDMGLPVLAIVPFEHPQADAGDVAAIREFEGELAMWLARFRTVALVTERAEAEFLVSGSLHVAGHELVVRVLLSDRSGAILWGDRLTAPAPDGPLDCASALAAQLAARLAQSHGALPQVGLRRLAERDFAARTGYETALLYDDFARDFDPAKRDRCQQALEVAVGSAPAAALPCASLARLLIDRYRFLPAGHAERADLMSRAEVLARRAVALDPQGWAGHMAQGHVLWFAGNPSAAIEALETARACNPNEAAIHAELARFYASRMDLAAAAARIASATALNPALAGAFRIATMLVAYASGRFDEAYDEACRLEAPGNLYVLTAKAASSGAAGNTAASRDAVDRIVAIAPDYGRMFHADMRDRNLSDRLIEALADGLRRAGLPGLPPGAATGQPGQRRAGPRLHAVNTGG